MKPRIAVEAIRSPHQNHDSEVVQLITELLHLWTVITDDVIGCRESEANRNTIEESEEDEDVSLGGQRIAQVQGLIGIDWSDEEKGRAGDMRIDVDSLIVNVS